MVCQKPASTVIIDVLHCNINKLIINSCYSIKASVYEVAFSYLITLITRYTSDDSRPYYLIEAIAGYLSKEL
jgi:hypothetical protein